MKLLSARVVLVLALYAMLHPCASSSAAGRKRVALAVMGLHAKWEQMPDFPDRYHPIVEMTLRNNSRVFVEYLFIEVQFLDAGSGKRFTEANQGQENLGAGATRKLKLEGVDSGPIRNAYADVNVK